LVVGLAWGFVPQKYFFNKKEKEKKRETLKAGASQQNLVRSF
jgi:hypothetical protein